MTTPWPGDDEKWWHFKQKVAFISRQKRPCNTFSQGKKYFFLTQGVEVLSLFSILLNRRSTYFMYFLESTFMHGSHVIIYQKLMLIQIYICICTCIHICIFKSEKSKVCEYNIIFLLFISRKLSFANPPNKSHGYFKREILIISKFVGKGSI